MDDISPVTPKKRYSCTSEYATPRGSDDSDNSLYYSFALHEDDVLNKENSINGGQWNVTDKNTSLRSRVSKAKTPLLRKVLQTNGTPPNKNNKRVSFSYSQNPNLTPGASVKVSKTFSDASENELIVELKPRTTFDLKLIEESLPLPEIGPDNITINDSASDVTDDLENELHNTIIENPSSTATNKMNMNTEKLSKCVSVKQDSCKKSPTAENPKESVPVQKLANGARPKGTFQPLSMANCETVANTRTVDEILHEAQKKVPQSRNATKIIRQNLASESRKSILATARKNTRATTYKRRSSTYEPRKFDARKSLGILKQVANKINKTIAVQELNTVNEMDNKNSRKDSNVTSKSNLSSKTVPKSSITKTEAVFRKPRLTMVNQPLRVPIVSTRQSTSASVRAQRRETKNSLTSFAFSKASTSTYGALSVANHTSSLQTKFLKPSDVPLRKPVAPTSSSAMVTSKSSGKCQYCDKFFAKSHGMMTHLLEKCEKIPASARRQLLQKEKDCDEANSKQVSRRKTEAFRQDNDFVSKYSRFFVNLTNDGVQGDGIAAIDVEKSLKNLRSELRKIRSAYTGITRTPSKPIRCHICKKLFLDCVEYADHSANHPPQNH